VIIVGASYDSYGESPDKLKWEDDIVRAKGVAQLLEIAQSWKKQDYAPRVTVLFVGWDAGMQEILGEEYYENHPQYPSENILATLKLNVENDGETTSSILLGLAEGDFFIHDLLTHRANAVMDGDLDAFLATSLASERPNDKIWFEDAQALSPLAYEMDFNNLEMVGNEATAEVKIALEAAGENGGSRKISSSVPIKFAFIVDAWHWAGADLHWADAPKTGEEIEDIQDTELPPYFEVAHPVNKSLESLGELAGEKYTEIVQLFGLEEVDDGKLYLFATEEAMRANSAMSLPRGEKRFITENTIKTVYSSEFSEGEDFTTLLVELLLTNAGISENAAPWLWEGLPLVILANETPVNIQGRFLPKLEDSLESETQKAAISWAAVDYLQRQKGWRGLGNFIAALGRACDSTNCKTEDGANLALKSALGMDAESFETAWQADWESRLENAQDGIREVLSARNSAIRNGNSNAFLATVDSRTPNLINEEKSWFADLAEYPLEFLTYNGQPLAFYEDGSLLVSVTTEWQLEGITEKWGGGSSTFNIRFEKSGNAYRWAGVPLENLYGQKIRIRYPAGKEEIAQNFLENAEEIYTELATDLGINNRRTQIINLYNNKNAYRTSVFMSYPDPKWMQGWSAQNHSLKIMLEEGKNIESYRLALSTHLTRQLLAQRGVHAEWMLTGGSNYFARGVDNGASQMQAAEQLYYLNKAVESESVFDFNNFPPLYRLSESEYKIGLPQAWDFVRYLVENENAFWNAAQTGRARPELVSAWQTSFESGHATATQISIAEAFNEQGAIEHIEFLTASEMTGRQAGSAGADLAADYIAEKFEGYGLEVQRQVFPVYYQYYLETPSLDLNLSGVEEKYLYHEDFMLIQAVESALKGELVWVMDEDYVDMNLEGNIAIRKPTTDIATEIANATSHGAGALILVGDLNRERERSAKYLTPTALPEGSIPVLEFTRSGFKRLLENSGQSIASIYGAPPALFLDIEATLNISLNENRESETANIFGFLPGSDPVLSDEIIILSAHYDHVGDDPKTLYSGANDDASGLATMLEIAELWQENNYQPKRSVLFVAWGAQELGEGGSYYYLSNPLYPLENIVSVYQLDAVSGGDAHHLDAQGARDQEGLSLFYIEKAQEILGGRLQLSLPKEEGVPPFSPDALFARETIRVSSDHDPFREMGIQALRIAWREANETNPSDEFTDEVNPKFLSTAGRLTILTVMMDAR
ncbi:MAG: M28 family peptidase, partial [Anaerolineae bacterium]|nr:M28 family peptidase [Anaerolineae bacterium]